MNITRWQRQEHRISRRGVHDFYDRQLPEVYLFDFVTSRLELPRHGGSFSIKLALAGEEEYYIGRRTLRVRPGSFLLVNGGETYASRIRSRTHSLSLFYPEQDLAAAQASLGADARRALDSAPGLSGSFTVPQFTCRLAAESQRQLAALRAALRLPDRAAANEAAAALLVALLRNLLGIAQRLSLQGVRKRATRDELIGRVLRAHEYLMDMRGRESSLDRLAQVACLSKFHFLRLFREVFGASPAAMARARRLDEARRALDHGQCEDAAAADAGYAGRHSLRRALGQAARTAQISNPG